MGKKKPIDKEPSDSWKKQMLLAEHSPIRMLEYDITIENIRQFVTVHFARHHIGIEKFIHTQREDINTSIQEQVEKVIEVLKKDNLLNEGWKNRDYMFQGSANDMDLSINAQAFINISRKRLCACASQETRQAWRIILEAVKEIDPILANACVAECVYRGFCPESKRSCGYVNTKSFKKEREEYIKL